MITKIVEFRIKKDKLQICLKAIKEFTKEVHKNEPNTLVYDSYQKDDKVSFIHLMSFKDARAEEFHRQTPWVKKFANTLYPNCELKPKFSNIKIVNLK